VFWFELKNAKKMTFKASIYLNFDETSDVPVRNSWFARNYNAHLFLSRLPSIFPPKTASTEEFQYRSSSDFMKEKNLKAKASLTLYRR
jgi:hypothetical protein